MSYTPTLKDFEEIEKDTSALSNIASGVEKYISGPIEKARIPEMAGGFLQGAIRGGESLANVPLSGLSKLLGKDVTLPYADLQQFARQDPVSIAAFGAGELGGYAVPGTAAYKGISGLTSKVMQPSIAREAIAGALTGGAVGGSEEPSTRVGSAILGGAIPVATGLTSKSISKNVLRNKSALESEYKQKYNQIFDSLKQLGLDDKNTRVPSSLRGKSGSELLSEVFEGNRSFQKPVNRYLENPNFENAHEAQSALRKLSARLTNQIKTSQRTGTPITPEKGNAARQAQQIRDKIRGSMQQFLLDNKTPELLNDYSQVTQGYREELAPFLNPSVSKLEQNKIKPKNFLNKLLQEEDFMRPGGAASKIPGLRTREILSDNVGGGVLNDLIKGGLIGAGASAAYGLGLPGVGRVFSRAND